MSILIFGIIILDGMHNILEILKTFGFFENGGTISQNGLKRISHLQNMKVISFHHLDCKLNYLQLSHDHSTYLHSISCIKGTFTTELHHKLLHENWDIK